MAAYLTSVIAGLFFITFYVEDIVSMSRYCTEQYECYKNCPITVKETTSCGLWDLSECTVYRERFYPCKSTCERVVCCNGYTGENCSTPLGCETATRLPDRNKRGRNYEVKGEDDNYVDDEYLGPAWFSVGQWKMPDSHTVPEDRACGTQIPIYIKGDHPEVTDLTGETVYHAVTCEWYPFNNCSNERKIDIRQCGDDTQYYLLRTSHRAAYCMDPPDIQGVTEMEYSASFFAGVKIHPSFINMKKEDTANLTLQPTVPDNLCSIGDTDTGSQPKVKDLQAKCGVEISGFLPKDIKNGHKQMSKISSPFFSNSDPTVYKLNLRTQNSGTHVIWKKAPISDFQVKTNIGTLIKNELLTDKYENMMNIDIYMAPKDLKSTKGLCGTFDDSKDNDLHDRNGNPVEEQALINSINFKNGKYTRPFF